MNKFLTYAGEQPVYLGDIDFMQNAASLAQELFLRAMMNNSMAPSAILQGIEFSMPQSGVIAWTGGVVAIDGEILAVAGGSISALSVDALYLHVASSLSGTRVFKDGTSHDCYETRTAVINTTSSGGVMVSSLERLHKPSQDATYEGSLLTGYVLAAKLLYKQGQWILCLKMNVAATGAAEYGSATFIINDATRAAFFPESPTYLYNMFPVVFVDGLAVESGIVEVRFSRTENAVTLTVLPPTGGNNVKGLMVMQSFVTNL